MSTAAAKKIRTRARETAEEPAGAPGISISVRFPNETIRRADKLAKRMERPGISVSRSGMLRAALLRGLDKLEAGNPGRARHGGAPKGSTDQLQTAVRLSLATVARIDELAKQVSQPELTVTRSEALRLAILRGLEVLEAEQRR
jgi:predicted DNA-binding protein